MEEINVLFPMAGKSKYFDTPEYPFPKPLIEVNGKPMIELVVNNYIKLGIKTNFIFVVNYDDVIKYHLDNILSLITNNQLRIVVLQKDTKGAACSSLMAIEYINNNIPLIISNYDQYFDCDLNSIYLKMKEHNYDAGVIVFESVHPRWSYVKVQGSKVIEAAEKNPISKNAIAGFYYFSQGKMFVDSAMHTIIKDAKVEGSFFIAPVLNELILENKTVGFEKIENDKYHSFYTPQKIKEYENYLWKNII